MGYTRFSIIDGICGLIGISLFLCSTSLAFGEALSINGVKGVETVSPGAAGFRSEESEISETSNKIAPLQSTVSSEELEFVETTDASGGVMIDLKGRFQSVLKVPSATKEVSVQELTPPVVP